MQKLTPKQKRKKDKQFSEYIRKRDGECKWCGRKEGRLNCSHIIPRGNLELRWNEANAVTLCYRCHLIRWHKSPLEGVKWIRSYLGDTHCDNLILSSSLQNNLNKDGD